VTFKAGKKKKAQIPSSTLQQVLEEP